ncbi:MAG: asparaginase [Herminiimonas sp.]|nr:asparaginase [Herminiimonas sp.]
MTLRIIATGGTFDKHYDEINGALVFGASHLPEALRRARIAQPSTLEQLPFLDSLDMQAPDRQRILDACQRAAESRIVIIHGTDTMPDTAQVLGMAGMHKTVVLTGAMIPFEIDGSDALFNLGFACGVAQTLAPGVYVAMNAQVFAWDKVRKNRIAGVFESL